MCRSEPSKAVSAVVALVCAVGMFASLFSALASARVGLVQAPHMDAVALAGSGAVVAPNQQLVELVAAGVPPRVLAEGPGLGGTGGSHEDYTETLLQFAASAQAFAYQTASQGSYKAGASGLYDLTGFGPLAGPYSTFPGTSGMVSCSAGYPDASFLSEGPSGAPDLLSGAFALDGARLATWPSCTSADAVLVRDLQGPGADLQVELPDVGSLLPEVGSPAETGKFADEVGEIALSGDTLGAIVGFTNADGVGPLAPEFLVVENTATGESLYGSYPVIPPSSHGDPIAVAPDGTAVVQIPTESRGGHLFATTYLATPANPTLRAISTDCVSVYGVELASGRVAQAVCGKGIVTTDLTGNDAETVLALGEIPVTAFDYDGESTVAVRPVCDGEDQVELAGASADPTPPPPTSCGASVLDTRPRVVRGAVRLAIRCARGCAGSLVLNRGRAHATAHFALAAPGGAVTVALSRALRKAADARGGALLASTLTVDTLTGGATRSHGRVRIGVRAVAAQP
jgi:hypothetical protein